MSPNPYLGDFRLVKLMSFSTHPSRIEYNFQTATKAGENRYKQTRNMATSTQTDFKVEATKVKWDPKSVEIRTRSVEKTLEPLVHQVSKKKLTYSLGQCLFFRPTCRLCLVLLRGLIIIERVAAFIDVKE